MPTYDILASFRRDWNRLTDEQKSAFRRATAQFLVDLADQERGFHPRLRIKRLQGHRHIWEMTWAPDGRTTFEYGNEIHAGEPHVVWRRIGTHSIFRRP